jgi:hypothetical protein
MGKVHAAHWHALVNENGPDQESTEPNTKQHEYHESPSSPIRSRLFPSSLEIIHFHAKGDRMKRRESTPRTRKNKGKALIR